MKKAPLISSLYNLEHRMDKTYDFDISSFDGFLKSFGSPQNRLGKIIHVAGTNGKGSVCTIIAEMLKEAGFRTGLYTSPHIDQVNERIKIGGKPISDRMFRKYEKIVYDRISKRGTSYRTYFEALTAMAFLYFADSKTDFAVIETGLGGRLDSTNVVSSDASVITVIDYDHKDILGKSIEKIAYEKAGIIKSGAPCFTFRQRKSAESVIRKVCREKGSALSFTDPAECRIKENGKFEYKGYKYESSYPAYYQALNCAIASDVCRHFKIDSRAIDAGIRNFRIEGRMEVLGKRPAVIADGSHNPAAVRETLKEVKAAARGKLFVIACFMADKDYSSSVKSIESAADAVYFTSIPFFRSAKCNDYEKFAHPCFKTPKEAYRSALKNAGPNDTILFIGSFYLISYARKAFASA